MGKTAGKRIEKKPPSSPPHRFCNGFAWNFSCMKQEGTERCCGRGRLLTRAGSWPRPRLRSAEPRPVPFGEDGEPAGHGAAASPGPADPAGPCWGANIRRARGRSVEGEPRRCAGWGRGARVWPCSAGVGPVRDTSWGSAPLAPVAPPMAQGLGGHGDTAKCPSAGVFS